MNVVFFNAIILLFLHFSGIFELNFMSIQPSSGYYQFTVAVTGDSRLVANHIEVRLCFLLHVPILLSLKPRGFVIESACGAPC